MRMRLRRRPRRKQYDLAPVDHADFPHGLAQHPLAPVAQYGCAKSLGSDKRNLTVTLARNTTDPHRPTIGPRTLAEDALELPLGLDGHHDSATAADG